MLGGNPVTRVLFNGRIHTMDSRLPKASALAIAGERIVAVGDDDECRALAGATTRVENLNRAAVYPGLIDAHVHWQWTAESYAQINLVDVPSSQQAVEQVRERAAALPPGEWIVGYGWSQDNWPDQQFPSAAALDAVTPDHPVYLRARSGHAAWVNTHALRLANIHAGTPNPTDGEIVRDASGEPTGVLFEWAVMDLVADLIPETPPDVLVERMIAAQAHAHALGLTGFHDFDMPSCLNALQTMRERGQMALRVVKQVYRDHIEAAHNSGLRAGFGDEWIRIGALKIFADGALGAHTAWMLEPYEGEPGNLGLCTADPAEMRAMMRRASLEHGMATTVHAIGDRAVREVLNAFESTRAEEDVHGIPRAARRHRVEHVQLIDPADVNRLAELDLIASMQPIHATSDYLMADAFWGVQRVPYSYNARLQLDRGVVVAFGSDSPVENISPIAGIHAAVTRQRADGSPGGDGWIPAARLSLDEALRAYTVGAAYAGGMEHQQGRLAPGFLADLIVMERDLYDLPPAELHTATVQATMVGGEWRYGGVD